MPPKIEVRTPVAMTGSHPPEMRRPTSTGLQNHMKDSLGLILPSITRLPSFIGLEVLQEACELHAPVLSVGIVLIALCSPVKDDDEQIQAS